MTAASIASVSDKITTCRVDAGKAANPKTKTKTKTANPKTKTKTKTANPKTKKNKNRAQSMPVERGRCEYRAETDKAGCSRLCL